ncbi:hypothetical protein EVAR_3582_1 [Eumeta japonica]|uniref:Uncharacterized protein n=1 Tax=Eumeta variegata TaxID=151549 RepID=A0A4C1SZ03_EUMVA|nr:hypothetical protein EVAR_3582_1 [Eumeta japonica]
MVTAAHGHPQLRGVASALPVFYEGLQLAKRGFALQTSNYSDPIYLNETSNDLERIRFDWTNNFRIRFGIFKDQFSNFNVFNTGHTKGSNVAVRRLLTGRETSRHHLVTLLAAKLRSPFAEGNIDDVTRLDEKNRPAGKAIPTLDIDRDTRLCDA